MAGTNQIDRFQRLPSDLRRYLEFKEYIIAEYGSIMRFVVKERLRWGEGTAEDLKPKGRPFEYAGSFDRTYSCLLLLRWDMLSTDVMVRGHAYSVQ